MYIAKKKLSKTKIEDYMERLDPYLRYVAISDSLPNKDFVKAYDCRFFFVLSGVGELRTEDKSYPLGANTLAYYPSGTAYHLMSSEENPLTFVSVNFDFTRTYPRRVATLRPVPVCDFSPELERPTYSEIGEVSFLSTFTLEHAFGLREDFVSLASHFEKRGAYGEELCAALLKYIILKVAVNFAAPVEENEVVERVMSFIELNSEFGLDNGSIAARFGYHPYYLSSLFKKHTGKTLHRYALEARLRYGSELLLGTELSLGEIAAKCGFANVNHFSVKFKQQYEESPAKWRCKNRVI